MNNILCLSQHVGSSKDSWSEPKQGYTQKLQTQGLLSQIVSTL